MNGATGTSGTETGAYTLSGGTSGNAPAVNPGVMFYIPTENQWHKAAYYKRGSTGNFANYTSAASWNSQTDKVTTAVTRGGATAYGAVDMSGNVREWNDPRGAAPSTLSSFSKAGQ